MHEFNSSADLVRQSHPDIPIACFRPAAVTAAADWFLKHFPGKVFYAVKANPSQRVLDTLTEAGVRGFDAASLPEIEQVFHTNPDAEIIFMHPVKNRTSIEKAYFEYGVRSFAFDTADELEKILSCTNDAHDLTLILRLAVPNDDAQMPLSGKFGVSPDKAPSLLKAARLYAKRLGISFHVGSQTMSPHAYTRALGVVRQVMVQTGAPVEIIDVGGGFPSVYPGFQPPSMPEYMKAVKAGIQSLPNHKSIEFWCEPGRALVAESTSVVVRVELRKGDTLYINDGTYGSLFDAGHLGFKYPVRRIRTARGGTTAKPVFEPFSFYGPTCDSIDYMPGPFFLPSDIREGDYIEIGMLGAYGAAMRTNFNGFYASETVIVHDKPMVTMYKTTYKTSRNFKRILENHESTEKTVAQSQ